MMLKNNNVRERFLKFIQEVSKYFGFKNKRSLIRKVFAKFISQLKLKILEKETQNLNPP